tara:strand:+ start:34 stop:276 length:243 start_codon:yes stop_codon:yes gene_type:complete
MTDETYPLHREKKNGINNGNDGAYGSGGSMNNPMYRKIACDGNYEPMSGRGKQRYFKKKNGECLSKKKQFFELGNLKEGN